MHIGLECLNIYDDHEDGWIHIVAYVNQCKVIDR